ncbi:response regulator transcription factor [Actinophytocola sp.]|uniref:response regulator transcription factor n=1 Tax=Actinophytocola sp. TaxID=1872138 RepID=UPI002D7FC9AF|nr:response regulator transcription factor [Actinophytocola sp.]HET9144282.1 response regulator transcription factor [Actinophytocola sp.]HEU5107246.1 response regulator transcription factor [Micromonosporaceae bacterium]
MPQFTRRPTQPGGLTVALADGLPLYREGLTALIHRTPGLRWVGAAERPNTALALCERFRPNVLVIDSDLDPRNHLSSMLASGDPTLGLLVLVAYPHRTTRYVASALAAGVHGVLLRTAEAPQVVDAIRTVHTDRRYVDAGLAPVLAAPRGRLAHPGGPAQPLSQREYQVLQLIADGLENQAIARLLFVSVETVRTHVKSILRKLVARDRTHAVAVAFRTGVLTPEDTEQPPYSAHVGAFQDDSEGGTSVK